MTTITNRGEWTRGTSVSTSADRLTAYHVREFVRHMDLAEIPDNALVDDRHSFETRALIGLSVHHSATKDALPDEVRP